MTISDTGSMSTGSFCLVSFYKERHKDINVSLSLKSLPKMPSILLQAGLVDFQMGKRLHFGNVAPFSLDTTHIITPAYKICKHGTCHVKTCFMIYANNKGADHPAQSELSDQRLCCSLSR